MYFWIVALLMFVFPLLSVAAETLVFRSSVGLLGLVGKWFVFWVVGIRLFTAGLRQALQPGFTAQDIFGIKSSEAFVIVQELGFANLSMGTLGILTIFNQTWVLPAAIVGILFYGLAGLRHLFNKNRNLLENTALVSNLIMFALFAVYCFLSLRH